MRFAYKKFPYSFERDLWNTGNLISQNSYGGGFVLLESDGNLCVYENTDSNGNIKNTWCLLDNDNMRKSGNVLYIYSYPDRIASVLWIINKNDGTYKIIKEDS